MKDYEIPQTGESASAPLQSQTSPPHRILLAEDDENIRCLNAEVLIDSGYRVDAAEDGAVAWEALNTDTYDLLITDNNMPKVTGVELIKKLRGARMTLPVIMATGILPEDEFTRNPRLQPLATLLKPYSIAELLGTVREILRATDSSREQIALPPNWQSQPLPNRLQL